MKRLPSLRIILCLGAFVSILAAVHRPLLAFYYQQRAGQTLAQVVTAGENEYGGFACSHPFVEDFRQRKLLLDAATDLRRAQSYFPNQSYIYYLLGRTFCLLGDYENAIKAFLDFAELRPRNPLGYLELGFALLQACPPVGKCSESLDVHNAWRKAGISVESLLAAAEEARRKGDYGIALFWYQNAQRMGMELRSTIIFMRYSLAMKVGDSAKALELLQRAIELNRGWLDQGMRFDAWLELGKVCYHQGNYKCAERVFSTIIAEYKDNVLFIGRLPEVLMHLSNTYLAEKRLREASDAMQKALEFDRENITLPFVNFILEYTYDYDLAESTLRKAIITYPNSAYLSLWYLRLGDVYNFLRNWDGAVEAYEKALELDPSKWEAYIGLGWAKYERGDGVEAAINQFRKALLIEGSHENGYLAIGWALYREGRLSEADSWLAKALEKNPACYRCYASRGNVAWKNGNFPMAVSFFQSALQHNPKFDLAYYEMAQLFQLMGRYQDAITAIETAIRLRYPPNPDYYIRAGNIFEASGRIKDAISSYQTALQIDGNNITAIEALRRLGVGE